MHVAIVSNKSLDGGEMNEQYYPHRLVVVLMRVMFGCIIVSFSSWVMGAEPNPLDRCNDVLQADLTNLANSNTEAKASAEMAASEAFYSASDDVAYDKYRTAYARQAKEGSNQREGEDAFAHNYDHFLERDEFNDKYHKAQSEYSANKTSSSQGASSLISIVSSSTHDPQIVSAWETCMKTRGETEPGLFAYGQRDASGNPYVNVLWVPGYLVGVGNGTSISVRFTPPAGFGIEGVNPETGTEIAMGQGSVFAIRFNDKADRRAHADGFSVLLNGQLMQDNRPIRSYKATADIPRDFALDQATLPSGTIACSDLFREHQHFNVTTSFPLLKDADIQLITEGQERSEAPPTPPGTNGKKSFSGIIYKAVMEFRSPQQPVIKQSGRFLLSRQRATFVVDTVNGVKTTSSSLFQCNGNRTATTTLPSDGAQMVISF
jgi:hypothetical protein